MPADQADFPTATKFVNALLKNGVEVHTATDAFSVAGTTYPAGSYVVRADQAFRPHVLDMFEPQDHPNDFAYPGAPPTAPYDNAGWTLAYQMDVAFDRVLEDFDGPFEPIDWLAEAPAGEVTGSGNAAGWILSHDVNDAFLGVNRLLAAGHDVFWLNGGGEHHGEFFVDASGGAEGDVRELAAQVGLDFQGVSGRPAGEAMRLRPVKVGLWDRYGGSMPSGWTRFVLERFGFDYDLLYPQQLEGDLSDYDVLIFPDGAVPMTDEVNESDWRRRSRPSADQVPDEYRHMLGSTSVASTVPAVLEFARSGGTV
ncbi:MAG: peptidase, partial [Actinobacteria bacterium]|nr:peptidase [Actinomycetota bacterium]